MPNNQSQRGFSLLEILVAFTILAMALGVIMKVFSTGLSSTGLAGHYTRASLIAQSQLSLVGPQYPMEEGQYEGDYNDTYHWMITVEPHQWWEEGKDNLAEMVPFAAYEVSSEVIWGGKRKRSVLLKTLRLLSQSKCLGC